MAYDPKNFIQLLIMAVKNGVSDIHLRAGERPYFRMGGHLKSIKANPLSENDMRVICSVVIDDKSKLKDFANFKEYDCSYQYKNICRVRVNYLRFQGKSALIMRVINMQIPTIDKLGLPDNVRQIAEARRGLVLVTGVTGSGKSSTLAALLEEINSSREEHILTIEDPVEFLFTSKKCRITQRELGADTDSFKDALRGALRQDPDIIVIGEMRDSETIQIALKAAETGHLVFGTVHTTNAASTVNRVVSMFPSEEQENIQKRLAECLHATVSQRLLPTLDNKGRVVTQEIMINTVAMQECISGSEPLSGIYEFMEKADNMQSFDEHLLELYKEKRISYETALQAASSPTNFERNLQFGGTSGEDAHQRTSRVGLESSLSLESDEEEQEVEMEMDEDDEDMKLSI